MAWISELVGIEYITQRLCVVLLVPKDSTSKISQNAQSEFDRVSYDEQSEKGAGDGTVLEGMTSNERVLDKRKDALGANCMRHLHTGLDSGALRGRALKEVVDTVWHGWVEHIERCLSLLQFKRFLRLFSAFLRLRVRSRYTDFLDSFARQSNFDTTLRAQHAGRPTRWITLLHSAVILPCEVRGRSWG